MSQVTWMLLALMVLCNLLLVLFFVFYFIKFLKVRSKLHTLRAELTKQEKLSETQLAELAALKHQMHEVASKDSLTGLVSRQFFEDRLIQIVKQSKRHSMTFAVLVMNFNEIKMIHDALGLETGDRVLRECAERLQSSVRQLDTISRLSNEDFVFIFPQLSKPETAAYVAQRLLGVMAQPFFLQGKEIFISSYIGVAVYPKDGDDPRLLVKNAETAMHQAKQQGHDVYAFYQKEMQLASSREFALITGLHQTSVFHDFVVYYHPIVDVEKKQIHSMEVQVRWNHPDFGFIEPTEFLPLAEKKASIKSIGLWLLEKVCEQFQQWTLTGLGIRSLTIPIPIRLLDDPHFVINVTQILRRFQVDPESIIFEISESALMKISGMSEKSLLMLKELGFQLGIHEFSAGSLLIGQFQRFHFESIRITAAVLESFTIDDEKLAVLKMMIAFASALKMDLIVSGVETVKQMQALKHAGCHFMQGAVFGLPFIASEITPLVERAILDVVQAR